MKKIMTLAVVVKSPSIAASGRNAKPLIWRLWKLLTGGRCGMPDEAALGIARTCHRSILQPEPNASPHDGPVGQLAEATTLDLLGGGA
jgi:hypothetical protein